MTAVPPITRNVHLELVDKCGCVNLKNDNGGGRRGGLEVVMDGKGKDKDCGIQGGSGFGVMCV